MNKNAVIPPVGQEIEIPPYLPPQMSSTFAEPYLHLSPSSQVIWDGAVAGLGGVESHRLSWAEFQSAAPSLDCVVKDPPANSDEIVLQHESGALANFGSVTVIWPRFRLSSDFTKVHKVWVITVRGNPFSWKSHQAGLVEWAMERFGLSNDVAELSEPLFTMPFPDTVAVQTTGLGFALERAPVPEAWVSNELLTAQEAEERVASLNAAIAKHPLFQTVTT